MIKWYLAIITQILLEAGKLLLGVLDSLYLLERPSSNLYKTYLTLETARLYIEDFNCLNCIYFIKVVLGKFKKGIG